MVQECEKKIHNLQYEKLFLGLLLGLSLLT